MTPGTKDRHEARVLEACDLEEEISGGQTDLVRVVETHATVKEI